jgi:predicted CoA-binding protein
VTPDQVLDSSRYVLVIDYPDRDVPDALVRAGFEVIAHEGPTDLDYNVYGLDGDTVTRRQLDHVPSMADLVYTYRPLDELQGIAASAHKLGAKAVWVQPDTGHDSARGRAIVETLGMAYVDAPDIREAVRAREARR